ncbi:MAG: serine/threonine-protein kinase [Caldilineaceae bacterium]
MTNLTGRTLGKYQLVDRLGQGGIAEVYKAFQPGVERFVASKVLHGHLVHSGDFVARFQREARAVGRLHHPNIVRVIDFDQEADVHYMIMDYIQGGTLAAYLKDRRLLPVTAALRIGAQLADALAYAHAQGMIHRDIKPANVMFTDATHTQAVLTDFGLAHLCDSNEARLTMTGAMVGTPTYMSPEAVRGEPCDERSDIYSLGVVLYEMVTGKTPYVANTPYSMIMKQANEPLPSPRSLNPALPVMVEDLLLRALAKEPEERYQSALDFASAIHQVLTVLGVTQALPMQSPTVTPSPISGVAPMPSSEQVSKSHWLPLLLALGGVILVAGLTAFLLMGI